QVRRPSVSGLRLFLELPGASPSAGIRVSTGRVTSTSRAFAPLDLAQLISIALIWGVNNILAKIAVDALPAMLMAGTRFAIVLALLFMWLRPPPKGQWKLFFLMLMFVGPLH